MQHNMSSQHAGSLGIIVVFIKQKVKGFSVLPARQLDGCKTEHECGSEYFGSFLKSPTRPGKLGIQAITQNWLHFALLPP
jgi:hypothetical protein